MCKNYLTELNFFGPDFAVFNKPIGPFSEFQWLLFVILPFGPIILELQGEMRLLDVYDPDGNRIQLAQEL